MMENASSSREDKLLSARKKLKSYRAKQGRTSSGSGSASVASPTSAPSTPSRKTRHSVHKSRKSSISGNNHNSPAATTPTRQLQLQQQQYQHAHRRSLSQSGRQQHCAKRASMSGSSTSNRRHSRNVSISITSLSTAAALTQPATANSPQFATVPNGQANSNGSPSPPPSTSFSPAPQGPSSPSLSSGNFLNQRIHPSASPKVPFSPPASSQSAFSTMLRAGPVPSPSKQNNNNNNLTLTGSTTTTTPGALTYTTAPNGRILSPSSSPLLNQASSSSSAANRVKSNNYFPFKRASLQGIKASPTAFVGLPAAATSAAFSFGSASLNSSTASALASTSSAAAGPGSSSGGAPGSHARRPSKHARRTSVSTRRESMEIMAGTPFSLLNAANIPSSPDPNGSYETGGKDTSYSVTGAFLNSTSSEMSRSSTNASTASSSSGWTSDHTVTGGLDEASEDDSQDELARSRALNALEGRLTERVEAIELPSEDTFLLPFTSAGNGGASPASSSKLMEKRASWNGNPLANVGGKGALDLGMLVEEEEEEDEEENDNDPPEGRSAEPLKAETVSAPSESRKEGKSSSDSSGAHSKTSSGQRKQRPASLVFPPATSLPFSGSNAIHKQQGDPISPTTRERTLPGVQPQVQYARVPRPLSLSSNLSTPATATATATPSTAYSSSQKRLSGLRSLTLATSPEHGMNGVASGLSTAYSTTSTAWSASTISQPTSTTNSNGKRRLSLLANQHGRDNVASASSPKPGKRPLSMHSAISTFSTRTTQNIPSTSASISTVASPDASTNSIREGLRAFQLGSGSTSPQAVTNASGPTRARKQSPSLSSNLGNSSSSQLASYTPSRQSASFSTRGAMPSVMQQQFSGFNFNNRQTPSPGSASTKFPPAMASPTFFGSAKVGNPLMSSTSTTWSSSPFASGSQKHAFGPGSRRYSDMSFASSAGGPFGFGDLVMEGDSVSDEQQQQREDDDEAGNDADASCSIAVIDEDDSRDFPSDVDGETDIEQTERQDFLGVQRPPLSRSNSSSSSVGASEDPVILSMQVQALRSQVEHLRTENASLTNQLAGLEESKQIEVESLRLELAEIREDANNLDMEREMLKEDIDGWRMRCNDLEKALKAERSRSEDERKEGILLREKVKKLGDRLAATQSSAISPGQEKDEEQALVGAQAKLIAEMRDQIFSLAAALERERLKNAGEDGSRTTSPLLKALTSQQQSDQDSTASSSATSTVVPSPASTVARAGIPSPAFKNASNAKAGVAISRHHDSGSAAGSNASSYNFSVSSASGSVSGSLRSGILGSGNLTEDTSIGDEDCSVFGNPLHMTKSPASPAFTSASSSFSGSAAYQSGSGSSTGMGISIHSMSLPLRPIDSALNLGGLQTLAEEEEGDDEGDYDVDGQAGFKLPALVPDELRHRTQSASTASTTDASEHLPLTPSKESPIASAAAVDDDQHPKPGHHRSDSFIRQWSFPKGPVVARPSLDDSDRFWSIRHDSLPPLPVASNVFETPFSEIAVDEGYFSSAFSRVASPRPSSLLSQGPPPSRSSSASQRLSADSTASLPTPSVAPSSVGSRLSWMWSGFSRASSPAAAVVHSTTSAQDGKGNVPSVLATTTLEDEENDQQQMLMTMRDTHSRSPYSSMDSADSTSLAPPLPPKASSFLSPMVGFVSPRRGSIRVEATPVGLLDFTHACGCESGPARVIRV